MKMSVTNRFTMSMAICFSLLCTACGGGKLDLSGKNAEQTAASIKELNKKITDVVMQPTVDGPTIACMTWLSTMSPLLMEQSGYKKVLQSIAQAKGNENIGWVLLFLNETGTDKFGNQKPVLALKLSWSMETLKQINWEKIADHQVVELAYIEGLGPFGKDAINSYCKDGGATSYAIEFCKRAGWPQ